MIANSEMVPISVLIPFDLNICPPVISDKYKGTTAAGFIMELEK
jgi:hypothetical protein